MASFAHRSGGGANRSVSPLQPPSPSHRCSGNSPTSGYHHHCFSSKRKLDDYGSGCDDDDDDPDFSDLISVRMRKDESSLANLHSSFNGDDNQSSLLSNPLDTTRVCDGNSSLGSCASCVSSAPLAPTRSASRIQFFIRMITNGNHIVVHAKSYDTVKSLHERIQVITGIPVIEQRLVYMGKQLQWGQSLAECSIQNGAGLHLVGRMRSTNHSKTCRVLDDMVSFICLQCKGTFPCLVEPAKHIKYMMDEFFSLMLKDKNDSASAHIHVFMSSSAPTALVMLYVSTISDNREVAFSSVRHFLNSCRNSFSKHLYTQFAPVLLDFCKLLRKVGLNDPLYIYCRSRFGSLLDDAWGFPGSSRYAGVEDVKGLVVIEEIFPFVSELAERLSTDLVLSLESPTSVGPLASDVRDFSAFLCPLCSGIMEPLGVDGPIFMPLDKRGLSHSLYAEEIEQLHVIFLDLLLKMDDCLMKMEGSLPQKPNGERVPYAETIPSHTGWSQYLAILKVLDSIAKLYKGAEEKFWTVLRDRKGSLCVLIFKYATRADDYQWLLQHKEVTDFESRRHLAMMMFPEVKEDYGWLHELRIDRSNLLSESFEYITHAKPDALHSLFVEFKNEVASGPGVLREWFFLVTQAIFNPQNALFVACPNDWRRFYPNPASNVDPMHLNYFTFSGRVIALALMHKVQVGVVFDRVFFLQLAGMHISLEDIRDADPFLYGSCMKILEMDAEFIDSDALGLTFDTEIEESGSRRTVELCAGGRSIVVNSKNREEYINLLIQHHFVTSISEQVFHFAHGFADVLGNSGNRSVFFQSLELEDLDWMLYGSESALCIEDWKAHTDYTGYKENDPHISWFWKIIEEMSTEQRRVLLFFWTSVKYLPVQGFRALGSRLCIHKSSVPHDRLPTSRTCFYQLCFPAYPSMTDMQNRLRVIIQEHIGYSFGDG